MNKLRYTPERIGQMSYSDKVEAAGKMYISKDNTCTQQEIANQFGISRSSISKSINSSGVVVSCERILSLEQESLLIKWIEDEIDLNHAVTKDRIKKKVCTMYTERVGKSRDTVSDDWWLNFRNRHPEIKLKLLKFQDQKRIDATKDLDKAAFWLRAWEIIHKIKPENVVNIDEKGILFTKSNSKVVVISKENDKGEVENKRSALPKQFQSQHFTLVGKITAAGTAIKSSYVLQMNNNLKMNIDFPASVGDVFINNSGFVDQEIKKKILIQMLESMDVNEEKLIIVDNHSSNYFVDAPTLKSKYKCTMLTFPSNTTHVLQPLESVVFSSFTAHMNKLVINILSEDNCGKINKIKPDHYPALSHNAWSQSFTFNNIMQSWAKVGFLKFDRLNIIDERFLKASLPLPQPTSNQLVPTNSSTAIVPVNANDKKAITIAMRKNKELGCELTSETVGLMVRHQYDARASKRPKIASPNGNVLMVNNNYTQINNNILNQNNPQNQPELISSTTTNSQNQTTMSQNVLFPQLKKFIIVL
ncbi:hypothetical protein ACTFIY_010253 [Dictyostelium cf. discoideum]